jgi:hypothetical protein
MAELPTSLPVAIWLVASVWLVAIVGHLVGAPREIVCVAFILGIGAGLAEWIAREGQDR